MAGFQIQCTTTSPGESVTMPFVTGYTYDCYIDWDDATPPVHVTSWDDPNASHTYAMAGSYVPEVTGTCPAWSVNNTHSSKLQWTGIVYWGDAVDFDGWEYLDGAWYGCANLASLGSGQIISNGLASLSNAFRSIGANTSGVTIPSGIFDGLTDVTNISLLFYASKLSGNLPSGLLDYFTNVTNISRIFQNVTGLSGGIPSCFFANLTNVSFWNYAFTNVSSIRIPYDLWYSDGEQSTRFLNKSSNFFHCFDGCGTDYTDNVIPDVWTCGFGTATPSHDNWIDGHSASTATNYNFVPISWGGTAFNPSIKPLPGAYAYEGLDVGQLRDFFSKLLTGAYAYEGLDVGQLRDFYSKLLPGSYAYEGLDVGQLRDFTSKLLTGSYAYEGLDVGQLRDFLSKLLPGSYAYEGLDANIITPTRGLGVGAYTYSGLALRVLSPYHPMTAVLAWIQGIVGSGIPVIFADQNVPVPTGIYLSVRFVTRTSTPDKIANSRRSGSVIRYHMESSDILGVDVKAFSAAGSSLLSQIELGTRDPHSKGVPALIDCGPIYGPTFFNDTHYRPMYHREFRFRVPAVLDTVGSRVQTLGLGGDVDDLEPSVEETFE